MAAYIDFAWPLWHIFHYIFSFWIGNFTKSVIIKVFWPHIGNALQGAEARTSSWTYDIINRF